MDGESGEVGNPYLPLGFGGDPSLFGLFQRMKMGAFQRDAQIQVDRSGSAGFPDNGRVFRSRILRGKAEWSGAVVVARFNPDDNSGPGEGGLGGFEAADGLLGAFQRGKGMSGGAVRGVGAMGGYTAGRGRFGLGNGAGETEQNQPEHSFEPAVEGLGGE